MYAIATMQLLSNYFDAFNFKLISSLKLAGIVTNDPAIYKLLRIYVLSFTKRLGIL